jgi:predicted nucleic acid-binding Zn ribbon protein
VVDRDTSDHPRVTGSDVSRPTTGDKPVDSVDKAVTLRPSDARNGRDAAALNTQKGVDDERSAVSNTDSDYPQLRGPDLARAALQAAKEASGAAGPKKKKQVTRGSGGGSRRRRRWSGAGPDSRDPQPLGRLASRVAVDRGWTDQLASGQLFGRWAAIVGTDVAEHSQPVALKDGELTIQAESTAWATQLRLLQRQLLVKIAAGVGNGVVTKLKVHGPSTPSWRYGPRHVRGRGPRDTYG